MEHLSGYLYRVRRNGRFYLFHQLPDLQKLEGFFSDAVYLCRTFSCPYMNNLAGIVYDSERQHVRGVLTKDTQHLRSLYDILSRSDRVEDRIPVSVRLRWAVQVVTTLVALSDVASSKHGNLTLKSIFLVPPEEEPNAQSPTFHVRVNPLTEYNVRVSSPMADQIPVTTRPYLAPELMPPLVTGVPLWPYVSQGSDIYSIGPILWALAVYQANLPEVLPPLETQMFGQPDSSNARRCFIRAVHACRAALGQRVRDARLLLRMLQDNVVDG